MAYDSNDGVARLAAVLDARMRDHADKPLCLDFAEIQAMHHNPMYMADYVEHLDNVLKTTGEKVLQGAGTISHAQAIEKATKEYRKYQVQNLSPVEEEYLESIKNIQNIVKKKDNN